MHELSLVESVREIIEANAKQEGYGRVRTVVLEIGCLSCVEPEALRFCFDSVMAGTLAEGARLELILIEGEGICRDCGHRTTMETLYDPCPACGSRAVTIIRGREMRVRELEVASHFSIV